MNLHLSSLNLFVFLASSTSCGKEFHDLIMHCVQKYFLFAQLCSPTFSLSVSSFLPYKSQWNSMPFKTSRPLLNPSLFWWSHLFHSIAWLHLEAKSIFAVILNKPCCSESKVVAFWLNWQPDLVMAIWNVARMDVLFSKLFSEDLRCHGLSPFLSMKESPLRWCFTFQ